jgi:hypothetical protein
MPLCGYHPLMGKGLSSFGDGLVAAVLGKAVLRERSISEQMRAESDEFASVRVAVEQAMLSGSSEKRERLSAFHSVLTLAEYLLDFSGPLPNQSSELQELINNRVGQMIAILKEFENAYEQRSEQPCGERSSESVKAAF